MRTAAALAVLLIAGGVTAAALGATLPVPPLPTPTTPALPVRTPQLPSVKPRAPVPHAAVSVTHNSAVSGPATPGAPSPLGSSSGGSQASNAQASSSDSSQPSGGTSAHPAHRSGGPQLWLALAGRGFRRAVVLQVWLARGGRIVITVRRVFPQCGFAGSFAVHGHRGVNRIAFKGRVNGRPLAPGTYTIGAAGADATLVVARHRLAGDVLAAARARNACLELASNTRPSGTAPPRSSPTSAPPKTASSHGTLGTSTSRTAAGPTGSFSPARAKRAVTNPIVLGALAAAMLLLGVASLPQRAVAGARARYFVARFRLEIGLAGTVALAGALVALIAG